MVPARFWAYAFQTATHLINRMPTPVLRHDTPYQKLFGHKPKYTPLRVFGCLCYPWLHPYSPHKLAPRSRPCVYLGFSVPHHAFICLDISSNRIFVSRHVVFFEKIFPYKDRSTPALHVSTESYAKYLNKFTGSHTRVPLHTTPQPTPTLRPSSNDPCMLSPSHVQVGSSTSSLLPAPCLSPFTIRPPSQSSPLHSAPNSVMAEGAPQPSDAILSPTTDCASPPPRSPLPLQVYTRGKSIAAPTTSPQLEPVVDTNPVPSPLSPPVQQSRMRTRAQNNIHKPKPIFDLHTHLSSTETESTSFTQANKSPKWRAAMCDEYHPLQQNNTWSLVPPSSDQNVVGCK